MDTNAWDKVQYDNKLENDKPVTSHKMVNCTEYLPETVWQNYVATTWHLTTISGCVYKELNIVVTKQCALKINDAGELQFGK